MRHVLIGWILVAAGSALATGPASAANTQAMLMAPAVRSTPAITLTVAADQPLATLSPGQASALGLSGDATAIMLTINELPGVPAGQTSQRITVSGTRENTAAAINRLQQPGQADRPSSTGHRVVLGFERNSSDGSWVLRSYQLNNKPMPSGSVKLATDKLTLLDSNQKTVEVLSVGHISGSMPLHSAIPMPAIMNTVLASGDPQPRVMLGITMSDVPETMASKLGLAPNTGVLVGSVLPDHAAAQAGVLPQDVLVWIGSEDNTASFEKVRVALKDKSPGDAIALGLNRDGQQLRVNATLREGVISQGSTATATGTVTMERAGLPLDRVFLALESERASLAEQIRQSEEELRQFAEQIASATGREASQISQKMAGLSNHIAGLTEHAMQIAERQQERLAEQFNTHSLSSLILTLDPESGGFAFPEQLILGNEDDAVFIIGGPRSANLGHQLADKLSATGQAAASRIDTLAAHVEQLRAMVESQLGNISNIKGFAITADDSFNQLPIALERIERAERESQERAKRIEDRLDRIERMLEELLADH